MPERQPSNDLMQWHSVMDQGRTPARSEGTPPRYLAHVRQNDDGLFAIHDLEEHLRAVGLSSESLICPLAVPIKNAKEKAEEWL